jgi:oxygen-independent coproporphyrinogen-3 oxidase
MKEMGVTRISVNPQTMSDETLKLIGRQHTVAQLIDSFNMAREEGFDNINMDIILGLPGETDRDVQHTIDEIIKLAPDDLTVHSLAIKRGSRLAEVMREKGVDYSMKNT